MNIRHTGIVVNDMEAMKAYYEGLGLKCVHDEVENVRIVKLKDKQGGMIELLQFETMSDNILRKKGISHVAFTQDPEGNQIEKVYERT